MEVEPGKEGLTTPKKGKWREYAESLFVALLIAFFIRSFVIEAFKIPSSSMTPTLVVGDHIFVNKFIYGLRIPLTKKKIVHFRNPKRGEAIVFIYPLDEGKDFIKRVVGLPGDSIQIRGDDVLVNGEKIDRQPIRIDPSQNPQSPRLRVIPDAAANEVHVASIPVFPGWRDFSYFVESLGSEHHLVQFDAGRSYDSRDFIVPTGHLFVMGDNRDNSSDSRDWGFVPLENVKGKAMFVWLSIDTDRKTLRWDRFGKWIR